MGIQDDPRPGPYGAFLCARKDQRGLAAPFGRKYAPHPTSFPQPYGKGAAAKPSQIGKVCPFPTSFPQPYGKSAVAGKPFGTV